MPGAFIGLNIMSSALRAFQRQLDVTGHNISNVNTPGYSRQVADLVEMDPSFFYTGTGRTALGNGVRINLISRVRDTYLDSRRMQCGSEQGRLGTLNAALGEIQSVFQETDSSGINHDLNAFFNAWSALASNPNEAGNRLNVQMAGQTLANGIRTSYQQLRSLNEATNAEVRDSLTQLQSLADSVANLNEEIVRAKALGSPPNDLLDRRDQVLRQMSEIANVSVVRGNNDSINVFISQFNLVDNGGSHPLPTSFDPATMTISDGSTSYAITTGKLAGLFQGINTTTRAMGQLDSLANSLRTEINALHASGTNRLGATGLNFFNDSNPQNGAIDFDLDSAIKADPNAIASSVGGTAGDGGLALALSRLRDSTVAALGTKTFARFYGDAVGQIASEAQTCMASVDQQDAIAMQIDQQIQSTSGVSIDDEMTNMLRFQRSYQAAAKCLSILDETTQDLIAMMR